MMNGTATCLIEKNPLLREGLKSLLQKSGFTPLAEFELIENYRKADWEETPCRLIVVGMQQDAPDEITAYIKAIKQKNSDIFVVILAETADRDSVTAVFSAGADGFLLKDMPTDAFIASLELVMAGGKAFPEVVISAITSGWGGTEEEISPAEHAKFSMRESEIVERLAEGSSNKLIANMLDITEATVKVHVKTILRKLKLSNRTQVAIWAVKNDAQPKHGSNGFAK